MITPMTCNPAGTLPLPVREAEWPVRRQRLGLVFYPRVQSAQGSSAVLTGH